MQIASSEQLNWNYSGNRKKRGCFHFEDGKVKILKRGSERKPKEGTIFRLKKWNQVYECVFI